MPILRVIVPLIAAEAVVWAVPTNCDVWPRNAFTRPACLQSHDGPRDIMGGGVTRRSHVGCVPVRR